MYSARNRLPKHSSTKAECYVYACIITSWILGNADLFLTPYEMMPTLFDGWIIVQVLSRVRITIRQKLYLVLPEPFNPFMFWRIFPDLSQNRVYVVKISLTWSVRIVGPPHYVFDLWGNIPDAQESPEYTSPHRPRFFILKGRTRQELRNIIRPHLACGAMHLLSFPVSCHAMPSTY